MIRSKLASYIGFAVRARKLVSGASTCSFAMKKGNVKLLIIASDISENSKEKLIAEAEKLKVNYRVYGLSEDLSRMAGSSVKSAFAVTDKNFSECILKELDNE